MALTYQPMNGLGQNSTYLIFLPDGSFDLTLTEQSDIDNANALLGPAIQHLQVQLNQTFNFWELINWIFVSFCWTFLADFGQINPSIEQIALPHTNNIFLNETLFDLYVISPTYSTSNTRRQLVPRVSSVGPCYV